MLIDQSMRKKRLKAWRHTAKMPSSSLGFSPSACCHRCGRRLNALEAFHHARYISWGATNLFDPQKWFNVRPGVQLKWVPTIAEANIPDADVVVATGWPPGGVYGRVFGVEGAEILPAATL